MRFKNLFDLLLHALHRNERNSLHILLMFPRTTTLQICCGIFTKDPRKISLTPYPWTFWGYNEVGSLKLSTLSPRTFTKFHEVFCSITYCVSKLRFFIHPLYTFSRRLQGRQHSSSCISHSLCEFFMNLLSVTVNAQQVHTQFCVHLHLRQWKRNRMYAINHVYISFIYKECKYTWNALNN